MSITSRLLVGSRFFQSNHQMKGLFSKFSAVEINDTLRENEVLEQHGMLVMSVIDDAITDINNVDKVEEMLMRTRNKHAAMTEFQNDFFWVGSKL